ncbi:MAG TPA: universal stress protein [Deltaproteobacteria bacterium]|nr:universal stress protein [Deltaproteobacteria bacterium]HIJ35917.1 universal stress protein [Deltaproteobacteria bacterium]HIJ41773.1 universal stress protein [Deltaproteobacteria bacterium]
MERHLLVTVSEKYDNLFAVRFVGNFFATKEEIKVTLLYLTPRPPRVFEADQETEFQAGKSEAIGRKALNQAKGELLKLGFEEDQVFTRLRPRRLSKVNEIIQEGSEGKYDAVVVGRRGLSWMEHAFNESVTRVLFEGTWDFPLWLCRKPEPERKHVLACVDGSESSNRMLDHVAFILKQAQNHDVTLLAVSRKGKVGERNAEEVLKKGRALLVEGGVSTDRIRFKVIHEVSPGKAIIKEANGQRYAAVAVGRTGAGMGLLKKVFVGSVSRALFRELEGAALWLA